MKKSEETKANERLAQEAWDHIQKTRRVSKDEKGACCYGGIGCAFSPAIDEESRSLLDEKDISANMIITNIVYSKYLKPWALNISPSFAGRVQGCHDNACSQHGDNFVKEFAVGLRRACIDYDVNLPEGVE